MTDINADQDSLAYILEREKSGRIKSSLACTQKRITCSESKLMQDSQVGKRENQLMKSPSSHVQARPDKHMCNITCVTYSLDTQAKEGGHTMHM